MSKCRIGIAIGLPQEIAIAVDGIRQSIASPQISIIEPHITILAPQNIRSGGLSARLYELRFACESFTPFEVSIGASGTFDDNQEVLFFGVQKSASLTELESLVRGAISDRVPLREFIPHVTLFEGKNEPLISAAVEVLKGFSASFLVSEIAIFVQDVKGAWQRYALVPFASKRIRVSGGISVAYLRAGRPGSWMVHVLGESCLRFRYSMYGGSDLSSGYDLTSSEAMLGYDSQANIVSASVVLLSGSDALLDYVWVAPSERGYGHASAMLDEMIYYLRQRKMRKLTLVGNKNANNPTFGRIVSIFESRGSKLIGSSLVLELL